MSAQGDHYESIPGAKKSAAQTYTEFENELNDRAASIASMLPSTLSIARFKNTVIAAVRQDPLILNASRRSIMSAVIRAAQDGLVPDGREGHIAVYNTNVAKKNEVPRWEKHAQWNPMAHGLRKRLRELDGIIANAEVVHENDAFLWHQGDNPRIEHTPAPLGTPRGEMIGAYTIFKREDGTILHREVMDRDQIEQTREQSKAKDSLMWTKFKSEGYRKASLRRGIKTVPVSDSMREIITRDDEENFEFNRAVDKPIALVPPPAPTTTHSIEHQQIVDPLISQPIPEEIERQLDRASMREMAHETAEPEAKRDEMAEWISDQIADAHKLKTISDVDALDDIVCRQLTEVGREDLRARWNGVYAELSAALKPKGRK